MFRTRSAVLGSGFLAALLAAGCGGGGGGTGYAPTADGQVATTAADTPVAITLTGADPNGDALTFVIDSQPQNGTLDATDLPTVTYTPGSGFTGVDSFTFHATDGALDSDVATVYIGVDNTAPTTSNVSDSTPEDTPLPVTLPGNDADGDALVWVIDVQPSHGTLSLVALPAVMYLPDADYDGNDSFSFHVTDQVDSSASATVDITVTPVNDAPVADDQSVSTPVETPVSITLTANDVEGDPLTWFIDTLPQHGTLTGTAPDLTYTPDAAYEGDDSFSFHVNDGEFDSNTAIAAIGVKRAGSVWAWGRNDRGQLGDGTATDRHVPVQAFTEAVAVAASGWHALALKGDGTVWAWGSNSYGELGDGTTTDRHSPTQVPGLTGVVSVAAGYGFSLALKGDRTVWGWGYNGSGRLGDGTSEDRSAPVRAQGLTGVVAIAAGHDHSLALRSDATVWGWGNNLYGQLGDGTTTSRSMPAQLLAGVAAVAAGESHSLALRADGTVLTWGRNHCGQLGDGTNENRLTPILILNEVTAIDGGGDHSIALKADGTVRTWGWNASGQLGDGTIQDRFAPVQILGITGVGAVSAGEYHSLALGADGAVWAWGLNSRGQLGDGTTTDRHAPVQTLGLSGVRAIAAGGAFSLAIVED